MTSEEPFMLSGKGNIGLKPCIFFDRDGIVNVSPGPGYVEHPQDFHIQAEFIDALRVVHEKGYPAILITNQRGVGRGIMSMDRLSEIHDRMKAVLAAEGLGFDGIYVCTDPERSSPRRKPRPYMLMQAARDHALDLPRSWMIGDQESDVLAGQRAGCRTIHVHAATESTLADVHLQTIGELPACLRRVLE